MLIILLHYCSRRGHSITERRQPKGRFVIPPSSRRSWRRVALFLVFLPSRYSRTGGRGPCVGRWRWRPRRLDCDGPGPTSTNTDSSWSVWVRYGQLMTWWVHQQQQQQPLGHWWLQAGTHWLTVTPLRPCLSLHLANTAIFWLSPD